MGGRGASAGDGVKTVPYDKWGKFLDGGDRQDIIDENGDFIGYIEDRVIYNQEPDIRSVTKKEVLNDIDGWRNDDGTYGDEDTSIYLAYKDGSFVDVSELTGKAYKKTGIIGASISTGDYEMVWGGEINRRTGEFVTWRTWSEDGESGKSNSYSGYKAVSKYIERVKTTFNNPNGRGGYKTVREVIKRSTTVKVGDRGW